MQSVIFVHAHKIATGLTEKTVNMPINSDESTVVYVEHVGKLG
jgi:hypothetical protein